MGVLVLLVIAGLTGIVGHWLTRWLRGRTESSFMEYLTEARAQTLHSVMANLVSSFTIYASVPDDIHGKTLLLVILGSYTAGYTFDSGLNVDQKAVKEGTPPISKV